LPQIVDHLVFGVIAVAALQSRPRA
jgi:hypothetical protein